ncbi:hypothetical protein AB0I00_27835 [Streptomyces sp. NPDC050803]|uniref:hypothetical protein n=1 Tax=unclassified Streptomyces TaxID=2593676 RepID=UPI003417F54C
MPTREPPGHLAPHIPADDYRRAQATGQPVVIVVQGSTRHGIPWQRVLIPVAVAGAAAFGTWGLVVALCALLDAVAHTATVVAETVGPVSVGGLTLKFFGSKR